MLQTVVGIKICNAINMLTTRERTHKKKWYKNLHWNALERNESEIQRKSIA